MSGPLDIDHYKFQPVSDSPIEDDWRSAAPRTCPGYADDEGNCGDEVESGEYCSTHQREFDRDEEVANRTGDEDFAQLVSYPHLTD